MENGLVEIYLERLGSGEPATTGTPLATKMGPTFKDLAVRVPDDARAGAYLFSAVGYNEQSTERAGSGVVSFTVTRPPGARGIDGDEPPFDDGGATGGSSLSSDEIGDVGPVDLVSPAEDGAHASGTSTASPTPGGKTSSRVASVGGAAVSAPAASAPEAASGAAEQQASPEGATPSVSARTASGDLWSGLTAGTASQRGPGLVAGARAAAPEDAAVRRGLILSLVSGLVLLSLSGVAVAGRRRAKAGAAGSA
ncbi:MAG TPA: hypothetical protein VHM89_08110 [Acidimicrobiales bacterium]|nr:hypothetical protein [Acidimicrobiales bacterium]